MEVGHNAVSQVLQCRTLKEVLKTLIFDHLVLF